LGDRTNAEKPGVAAVREALKQLALARRESTSAGLVRYRRFQVQGDTGAEKTWLPCDADRPPIEGSVEYYVMKLMEFVQTFLVADRVGKDITTGPPLLPPIKLQVYIERILAVVYSGKPGDAPRYRPFPHLKLLDVKTQFVDFAGFLVVLLTDYARWAADGKLESVQFARKAADEAMAFLVADDTFIMDKDGRVGWAFVQKTQCRESAGRPVEQHRHIFPTARAIVAIQRYADAEQIDETLVVKARKLLHGASSWIESLSTRREAGLYFASDSNEQPFLADHIYATEALLSLHAQEKGQNAKLALRDRCQEAVNRLLKEVSDQRTVVDLDRPITHHIPIKGYDADVPYDNRATVATCMSTLCQGIDVVTAKEQRERIRRVCDRFLYMLLSDRRSPANLWPREYLQFHWTLGAVEALLRYARYVEPKVLNTTVESVEQAAEEMLDDKAFRDVFRKFLVDHIRHIED